MAGKRPDQYQIDPGEAGATDYKNLPQTGHGNSNLDDTVELDRQRLAQSEKEEKSGPIRRGSVPPSKDANRPLRASEAEEEIHPEPGAADSTFDRGNPLV